LRVTVQSPDIRLALNCPPSLRGAAARFSVLRKSLQPLMGPDWPLSRGDICLSCFSPSADKTCTLDGKRCPKVTDASVPPRYHPRADALAALTAALTWAAAPKGKGKSKDKDKAAGAGEA
jgi:hypothetical protein